MNMKRWISSILIICLLAVGLSACGSGSNKESDQKAGTIVEETKTQLTIVDQAGRKVTVPKKIDSIALCYRVVIRFLLSLEQGEKIKGIGKTEEFLKEIEPSLKKSVSVGQGVADIEALAELNPDVFFHKASDKKTLEAVEKIGIPAVGIDVETPEKMRQAIDVMGKVCGASERAAEIMNYYDKKLAELKSLEDSIDSAKRKSAIMMGSSLGKVADGTMLQSEMIERAGGINPAKSLEASDLWPMAGVEQIFQWNPDYLFITNSESASYTPEDVLDDSAWSELSAVKKKQIFVMPAVLDSWEFPGTVSTLGIEYLMKTMYPELISEEKLESDVKEFYEFSYGQSFSRKELGY